MTEQTVMAAAGARSPPRRGLASDTGLARSRACLVRIVKATREGRWGKVRASQRLLTRSFSSKALAVKRIARTRER